MTVYDISGGYYLSSDPFTIGFDHLEIIDGGHDGIVQRINGEIIETIYGYFSFDPLGSDATVSKIVVENVTTGQVLFYFETDSFFYLDDYGMSSAYPISSGGSDILTGGSANDRLYARPGNDLVYGNSGIDTLLGGSGNDKLHGGDGDDALIGLIIQDYAGPSALDSDEIDGGSGFDSSFYRYAFQSATVTYDAWLGAIKVIDTRATDILTNVELLEFNRYVANNGVDGPTRFILVYPGSELTSTFSQAVARQRALGDGVGILAFNTITETVNTDGLDIWAELRSGGNDALTTTGGYDRIWAGAGIDIITSGAGDDTLYGEAGNDTLITEAGNDIALGGVGDDAINGGLGADRLYGEDDQDTVAGGSGSDRAYGGNGDDRLYGDADNDILLGHAGNDRLNGGDNADRAYGGDGDDIVVGGSGNDTLYGEAGNDRLYGGEGNDTALGGAGADTLNGEAGSDRFYGGADNDTILGGAGNDRLYGEDGIDRLYGDAGSDVLSGGAGNDRLEGGAGADALQGDGGNDTLIGGGQADEFVFAAANFGQDTVIDYEDGIDRLVVSSAVADGIEDFSISGDGTASVTLTLTADISQRILLQGFIGDPISLTAADFDFI